MEAAITLFTGIAIAVISSWITVRLSKKQFRSERWWEKKIEIYERVLDALHGSKKFSAEHMLHAIRGSELDEKRERELRLIAKEAREKILQAIDVGNFVMSDEASRILANYEAESGNIDPQNSWMEYVETDLAITDKCLESLIVAAKKDLSS